MARCLNTLCKGATEAGRYYCGEYCAYWGMLKRSDGIEFANARYRAFLAVAREKNHKNNIRLKESKVDTGGEGTKDTGRVPKAKRLPKKKLSSRGRRKVEK